MSTEMYDPATVREGLIVKRILVDTDGEKLQVKTLNLKTWENPETYEGATEDDLEKIRAFPQRKWSERDYCWNVPLTDPNVQHMLASWEQKRIQFTDGARVMVDYHLKTKQVADIKLRERLGFLKDGLVPDLEGYIYAEGMPPHGHQQIAFSSGRRSEYFALLMEMGTGKTKVIIDIICDRVRRQLAQWDGKGKRPQFRILIVAPKSVTHNWMSELAKHTTVGISADRIKGGQLDRMDQVIQLLKDVDDDGNPNDSEAIAAVINYEGLKILQDPLSMIPWDMMVLDESIWIKNSSTKRSKAAYKVGQAAKSRFILTGLPITKNVVDLYGQFHFLKEGCLGYSNKSAFKDNYDDQSAAWQKYQLPKLQELLSRFSFSIKRSQCLDLPPKTYQTLEITMAEDQALAYDQMLNDMIVDLEDIGDKEAKAEAAKVMEESIEGLGEAFANTSKMSIARIILVKLLRLSQITSGFVGGVGDKEIHRFSENPKLDALQEHLEELGPDDKVVVWSWFVEDLKQVYERFNDKYGVAMFYGGVKDADRERNINRFRNTKTCRIFAGQPQSGGFGINLVEANNVVYIANDYSLQNRMQSEDRCHRIGQTRNVLYTDLVVPNSIDQLVMSRIKDKKDLAELLTDRKRIVEALKAQLERRRLDK